MRTSREEQVRLMAKMRDDGLSNAEIAEKTGRKESTVAKYIGSDVTITKIEAMIGKASKLEEKRVTRSKICELTGLSCSTLRKYLGKKEIQRVTKQDAKMIKKMGEEGWSKSRIARELGFSRKTIAEQLEKMSVEDEPDVMQLCWSCARCATKRSKQCSWDARLEPVEGWTLDKDGFVVSCPEFEEGER